MGNVFKETPIVIFIFFTLFGRDCNKGFNKFSSARTTAVFFNSWSLISVARYTVSHHIVYCPY